MTRNETARKRVAIITMHKVINFGSALQAYALQRAMERLGCDASLIDYRYPNAFHSSRFARGPLFTRNLFGRILAKLKLKLLCKRKAQVRRFHEFWERRFVETRPYLTYEELREDSPQADVYVTGSDQVWNPRTMFGDAAFFLGFGDSGTRRIAYSASFGKASVPDAMKADYSSRLKRYDAISVRENAGRRLVEELSGKKAEVVCDPTLLLEKSDYESLTEGVSSLVREPYLLAYALDYAYNPRPAISRLIEETSKKLHLKVVYLVCGNTNEFRPGQITVSSAGPLEFLKLFEEASFVVTSSFHGTVFSLVYEKPFYSVTPAGGATSAGDSRIGSLLDSVGLRERCVPADAKAPATISTIDYGLYRNRISALREKGISFLKAELGV